MKKMIVLSVLFFCLFLSVLPVGKATAAVKCDMNFGGHELYEKCYKEIKKILENIDHETDIANSQLRMLLSLAESIRNMVNCDLGHKINHIVNRTDTIHENTRKVPCFLESLRDLLNQQFQQINSKLDDRLYCLESKLDALLA